MIVRIEIGSECFDRLHAALLEGFEQLPMNELDPVAIRFGTRGAVELAGIVGYYSMIAMTLNAHDIQPPARVFDD